MIRKKIFISSVQNEFQQERRMIADYIRQDALLSIYFEPFLFEELPVHLFQPTIKPRMKLTICQNQLNG